MSMRYLIGVDLGTTLAKCAVYDQEGTAIAEAQREMLVIYPAAGQAEQDPLIFYTRTCELIKTCITNSGINVKNVAAISIDSQMGGIMSIDKAFNPVTYYDTPLDCRSATENKYMHERFGELILEKNGSFSTYGNKILYWKKKNEWKEICKFVQPSGFVAGKLAGLSYKKAYIDETFICFSGLADLQRSEWSAELCHALDVNIDKLPSIIKSTDIIGELTRQGAHDTGLNAGVPIIAGCGDQTAGFVGAGILSSGQMADVSGTACILGACIDEYRCDKQNKTLACMKAAVGGNYYLISVVLGGRTHKWFIDEFFAEDQEITRLSDGNIYSLLDDKAKNVPPGCDGLLSIDYLQGRFFPPDASVRGLFIGHTWAHKKIHFYRSILESIAYDHYLTKEIIKTLEPKLNLKMVTAIGSGAKSHLWMQIKADILQIPYQNLFRSDLSTLGSAILGGYAVGVYGDIEAAVKKIAKANVRIDPRPQENIKYKKYIEIYAELFTALKGIYGKLSS